MILISAGHDDHWSVIHGIYSDLNTAPITVPFWDVKRILKNEHLHKNLVSISFIELNEMCNFISRISQNFMNSSLSFGWWYNNKCHICFCRKKRTFRNVRPCGTIRTDLVTYLHFPFQKQGVSHLMGAPNLLCHPHFDDICIDLPLVFVIRPEASLCFTPRDILIFLLLFHKEIVCFSASASWNPYILA